MTYVPTSMLFVTTCDPSFVQVIWVNGRAVPQFPNDPHPWLQLSALGGDWTALMAGQRVQASPSLQAAAAWILRHPDHPILLNLHADLGGEPMFCLLCPDALTVDMTRGELRLPGLPGFLELDERAAQEDEESWIIMCSGLLAVGLQHDFRMGSARVQVALWPISPELIAQMTSEQVPILQETA
ncbi:hypothetical protein E7T06_05230 [Deinococcus sp. Arct2-2]|uniref:hypothetical protein n=1 Tax=Deinococcus sp. Arct2-2 TaxID=2568653 RepID=UPI0010A3F723|nr:hypothetical protein [Deinococcus sp. Arct2-2]THF70959.1 hypothetical protein E7T06_05230 [Deinococcus sp. Arct2-2]